MDDLISRQAVLSFLRSWQNVDGYNWGERNIICAAINEVEALPSVEPETNCSEFPNNSDSISRQAAIDAIPQRMKGLGGESWMMTYRRSGYNDCVDACLDAIRNLPSAQPERADCTECEEYDRERHYCPKYCRVIRQTLEEAEQEQTGRWIYGEDENGIDGYHCNKCGFFVPWDYKHKFINFIEDYNYCPHCGTRMEGES